MREVNNSAVPAAGIIDKVKTMERPSVNSVDISTTFKPIRKTSIEDEGYARKASVSHSSSSSSPREESRDLQSRHNIKKRHSIGSGDHKVSTSHRGPQARHRHHEHGKPPINVDRQQPSSQNGRHLQRRSSSAMRVRELRDVLSGMTSRSTTPTPGGGEGDDGEGEPRILGSQKARLLVASQHRLISRLQDLRHELDSMDNEVARVRSDIMNSRRYFSAMTGLDWPTNRQMDSAYTSPTSFFSHSTGSSPYSSGADSPPAIIDPPNTNATDDLFQSLQNFEESTARPGVVELSRSDSCSSFLSWRSDVELAGVFPEEAEPASLDAYRGSWDRQMGRRSSRP